MGHVGILSGLIAAGIGLAAALFIPRLYSLTDRRLRLLAGLLTLVAGHLGASYGALYVGGLGTILCYIGGIWHLILTYQNPTCYHPD